MTEPVLATRMLAKRYGGLVVTDNLSIALAQGETRAVIGPNGAGKTTLIAELAGAVLPDAGSVLLAGRDVTRLAMHERVRLGLARSFQITSIFARFTVRENLLLAVQAHAGSSMRFIAPRARERDLYVRAERLADELALGDRLDVTAAQLSHAEQRCLEVGLALAGDPRVLLLDEPMAGLGPEESARMVELIARLKRRASIVLVEHDMEAVFRLADSITVLVGGREIVTGAPDAVRANEEVRAAYLGEEVPA